MAFGMTRAALENDLLNALKTATNLQREQAQEIVKAVAATIERNNREIERELGRKFADIERMIGR